MKNCQVNKKVKLFLNETGVSYKINVTKVSETIVSFISLLLQVLYYVIPVLVNKKQTVYIHVTT